MNRFGIFIGIVLLGVLGGIVVLNQGQKSQKPKVNNITNNLLNISPTLSDTFLTPSVIKITPTPPPAGGPTAAPSEVPKPITAASAVIKTVKGDITLTLYLNEAPNTVVNFVSKIKNGFYNNLTFHRVEDWVIQGGDPLGNGTGGGNMPTELNDKPFTAGSLGVARRQDIRISNDSQFFITKKDSVFLNGQYTNFGIVTKGMDVVEKIEVGDKIVGISVE